MHYVIWTNNSRGLYSIQIMKEKEEEEATSRPHGPSALSLSTKWYKKIF